MIGNDLSEMSNSMVSSNRAVIGGASVSHGVSDHSLRVLGLAIIGHIGHIAVIGGGVVVDVLDPAVRKGNRVGALGITGTVRALSSLEVGLGVVVGHGVGVGVGGGLSEVGGSNSVHHRGSSVLGGGRGGGHKGKGDEGLNEKYLKN